MGVLVVNSIVVFSIVVNFTFCGNKYNAQENLLYTKPDKNEYGLTRFKKKKVFEQGEKYYYLGLIIFILS